MNNTTLRLIAQRKALGLNMSELADLPWIAQDKRVIADYESGRREPAKSYVDSMRFISTHYDLLLKLLLRDIDSHHFKYPLPVTVEAGKYFERLKCVGPLILPYFASFEQFKRNTGNDNKCYWRLWQAVVAHLALTGNVVHINDDVLIPDTFASSKFWLEGNYNIEIEDEYNGQRD